MTNADMVIAIPSSPEHNLSPKALFNSAPGNKATQMECSVSSAPKFKLTGHPRPGRETVGYELEHRLKLFKQQQVSLDIDGNTEIEYSFFIADLGEVYRQ